MSGLEQTMSRLSGVSKSRGFSFMESAYSEPLVSRRYSATAIPCPSCCAEIGAACDGPRIHAERLDAAVELLHRNELQEAPESVQVEVEPCPDCGTKKTSRGSPRACDLPSHRCGRILPSPRRQCAAPVRPGTRYCQAHPPGGQRFN